MKTLYSSTLNNNRRNIFAGIILSSVFYFSLQQSYLLFHTIVELLSIVIAFAVFIITWNSRKMLDNNYLFFVGISYLFIGALDLLHTLTFTGMNIIVSPVYYANQFWVATRLLEALTFVAGFWFLNSRKKLNADLIFLSYLVISILILLSILYWHIFPLCFIEGSGQTKFKIYAEYIIIAILFLAGYLLYNKRSQFSESVVKLLTISLIFTILSEFCFTLYISNYSLINELGHYAKLVAFFMIYKANIETGFIRPTSLIFKNLKDNEEKYRTLAENLPGLILRFDQHFNCIYANLAVTKFSQNTPTEINNADSRHLELPKTLKDTLNLTLLQANSTGRIQETNISLKKEGLNYIYSVQAIPEYHTHTENKTYLVICHDITKQKNTEQQLQDLNATKDKFFSIIAHDLKNPFTSLLSFSQLIYKNAEKLSVEKIQHMAFRMNETAKNAYSLLENLLNWSRVQTGLLKPHPEFIDIADLLDQAKSTGGSMAIPKGIDIRISQLTSSTVFADRQMVGTIFRNIISNSVKFSYPNSYIIIKAENISSYIQFSIQDAGIGIEDVNQDLILKMDSNFSTLGTADEKGTGLGLVLCKEFVELNGGKLWLESKFGFGTTFYFTLPLN
ncbi:sensor histidine kinase [Arcticibacter eurypsychrophilus]|uniref:sensor histidine kinase n=1 Tax=Arcticibacter eurypsychrophilus TaxID=1434752 RepID=UPI00084DD9DF|nr:MASE3 domain-containing protein [Arcticibacter eurypsychrophilus]